MIIKRRARACHRATFHRRASSSRSRHSPRGGSAIWPRRRSLSFSLHPLGSAGFRPPEYGRLAIEAESQARSRGSLYPVHALDCLVVGFGGCRMEWDLFGSKLEVIFLFECRGFESVGQLTQGFLNSGVCL